jgi:ABC-type phosphate/phosphonate transport system substrate-binding protein
MTQATQPSLEPLADYLEPQFGNIYDYDILVRQEWTDELRQAVRHFIVDLAEDELYRHALERLGHERTHHTSFYSASTCRT